MRRVILESPYAGDIERNVAYARACVRDSLSRGEAPIASHLLYTQPGILDDAIPEERNWGIAAGLAWRTVAEATVAYTDLGVSRGMSYGLSLAREAGIPVEERSLPQWQNGESVGSAHPEVHALDGGNGLDTASADRSPDAGNPK